MNAQTRERLNKIIDLYEIERGSKRITFDFNDDGIWLYIFEGNNIVINETLNHSASDKEFEARLNMVKGFLN